MRRVITGLVATVVVAGPAFAAVADNQKTAERIASRLRTSGQLSEYKMGVKYQDGTTWLTGRVRSEEQMNTALKLVFQMSNVSRVINNLQIGAGKSPTASKRPTLRSPEAGANGGAAPQSQLVPSARSTLAGRLKQSAVSGRTTKMTRSGVAEEVRGQPGAADRLQGARRQVARPRGGGSASGTRGRERISTDSHRAERVPSSFVAAPARRTAASQHPRLHQRPRPMGPSRTGRPTRAGYQAPVHADPAYAAPAGPRPMFTPAAGGGVAPVRYDQPHMPNYAWPSYAAYPNYAAVTYPRQYSPTAWPYIGPFYPYPQVPLGWRKVTLEWDDGWWMLDFKDR